MNSHFVIEPIALFTKFLLTSYQVQHMRRNLDQSEAAIIQVFEEKQRVWERQMDELRQNYASRLQQVIISVINFKLVTSPTREVVSDATRPSKLLLKMTPPSFSEV